MTQLEMAEAIYEGLYTRNVYEDSGTFFMKMMASGYTFADITGLLVIGKLGMKDASAFFEKCTEDERFNIGTIQQKVAERFGIEQKLLQYIEALHRGNMLAATIVEKLEGGIELASA